MGIHLPRSPLLEAVFELRLAEGSTFSPATLDELAGRFLDRYPFPLSVEDVNVNVTANTAERSTTPRYQFMDEAKRAMVQLTPVTVAVNQLRDYVKWPEFRAKIMEAAADFLSVAGETPVGRIGLRYINGLHLPATGNAAEIIAAAPPSIIAGSLAAFFQRYEFVYERGVLIHQSMKVESPEGPKVMLDLDFGIVQSGPLELQNLRADLDSAHDIIESAFISSLKESYYATLQENS